MRVLERNGEYRYIIGDYIRYTQNYFRITNDQKIHLYIENNQISAYKLTKNVVRWLFTDEQPYLNDEEANTYMKIVKTLLNNKMNNNLIKI